MSDVLRWTAALVLLGLVGSSHAAARRAPRRVRVLHPLPGMTECVEMYSSCGPGPDGAERCTSAPFVLACGQTRPSPHRRDRALLRCECP